MPPSSRSNSRRSNSISSSSGNRTPLPHILQTAPVRVRGHHHRREDSDFSEWSRSPSIASAVGGGGGSRSGSTTIGIRNINDKSSVNPLLSTTNHTTAQCGGGLTRPNPQRVSPVTIIDPSCQDDATNNNTKNIFYPRGNSPAAVLPAPLQPTELLAQYSSSNQNQQHQYHQYPSPASASNSAFSPQNNNNNKTPTSTNARARPPLPLAPSPKLFQQQHNYQNQNQNQQHNYQRRSSIASVQSIPSNRSSIQDLSEYLHVQDNTPTNQQQRHYVKPTTTSIAPFPHIPLPKRLKIFFGFYNKAMIPQIDPLVKRYGHREEDLWRQLYKKYGQYPDDDDDDFLSTPNASPQGSPNQKSLNNNNNNNNNNIDYDIINGTNIEPTPQRTTRGVKSANPRLRRELLRYFKYYDPLLRLKVDAIMDAFGDFEDQLWESLENKYGLKSVAMKATERDNHDEDETELLLAQTNSSLGMEDKKQRELMIQYPFLKPDKTDLTSRLKRFFFKVDDKDRIERAGELAELYGESEKKEEELFTMLESLYGQTPDLSPEAQAAKEEEEERLNGTTSSSNNNKTFARRVGLSTEPLRTREEAERWLMSFCAKYSQERMKQIPFILDRFKGKKMQLLREVIESIFGVTHPIQEGLTYTQKQELDRKNAQQRDFYERTRRFRDRLYRFFNVYDHKRISEVDDIARQFEEFEDQLFQKLTKRYGNEPAYGEKLAEVKRRITRIYKKYNPDALGQVDDLIFRHSGNEDHLVQMLVKKYCPHGNEPTIDSDDPESIVIEYRRRLIRFFEYYEPIQLKTNLEKLLKTYEGREAEMMKALVATYGPEPEYSPNARATSPNAASASAIRQRARSKSSVKRFVEQVAIKKDREDEADYQRRLSDAIGEFAEQQDDENNNYDDDHTEDEREAEALAMSHNTRKRLLNFFAFYDPPRTRDISQICTIFAGREDEMWKVLRSRYGPEPPGENKLSKAALETSKRILRGVVDRFYSHYDPSRASYEADVIVNQYIGREEECREMLQRRFGPEPTFNILTEDTRKRLILFFQHYDQEQIANVDVIAEAYIGMEDQLFDLLTSQYGPEPEYKNSDPAEFQMRLARFFKEYPEARSMEEELPDGKFRNGCSTLQQIVEKYEDWEDELFMDLVARHGPEPEDPDVVMGEQKRKEREEQARRSLRARLMLFFEEYDEDQIANIDTLLDSYWTEPDELMRLLCESYGVSADENTPGFLPVSNSSGAADEGNTNTNHRVKNDDESSSTSSSANNKQLSPSASMQIALQHGGSLPNRVLRIYQKYNPDALEGIEKIFAKYEGREEELLERLVEKYGPEPSLDAELPPLPPQFVTPSASLELSPSGVSTIKRKEQEEEREKQLQLQQQQQLADMMNTNTSNKNNQQQPQHIDPSSSSAADFSPSSPINKNKPTKTKKVNPRERAIRILQIYDPKKLPQIDRLCKKFSSDPEGLVDYLEEIYELEPGTLSKYSQPLTIQYSEEFSKYQREAQQEMVLEAQKAGEDVDDLTNLSIRDRVMRIFKYYDPSRIQLLDIELHENAHRQEEYLNDVLNELGPEPPGNSQDLSFRYRVLKFFQEFNPSKISEVDAVIQKFKGRETHLMKMFITKYGSTEPPDPVPLPVPKYSKEQIRRIVSKVYRKQAPEKLKTMDEVIDAFQFDYETLLINLAQKYNLSLDLPPEEYQYFKNRLEAIFWKFEPDKIAEIDSILDKNRFLEDEYINEELKRKYGFFNEQMEEQWKREMHEAKGTSTSADDNNGYNNLPPPVPPFVSGAPDTSPSPETNSNNDAPANNELAEAAAKLKETEEKMMKHQEEQKKIKKKNDDDDLSEDDNL